MAARLASLAAAACLALPGVAQAANTYVDEDRPNNLGDCLTPATACKTIGGAGAGLAKSGPGDTVFVDGGTYNEGLILGAGRSLIYQEFGASDPPAIVNGGGMPAIEVPNGGFAGTVQGLTIRGSEGSLKAFGPVTVTGNTFDDGEGTFTTTQASLHLEDDAAQFEVTGNHFIDPDATGFPGSDDRYGIKLLLSGTATARVNDNTFDGLQEGVHADASPKRPMEISRNTFTRVHARSDETAAGVAVSLNGIQAFLERNRMSDPYPFMGGTIGVLAQNGSLTLYRNRIEDHSSAVTVCGNTFATLNGDVLYENGVGVFVNDCPPDDPVDIKSSVLWENSFADVHMIGGELNIDSSILSNPISKAGSATTPFFCTIVFSRGPTTAGTDPDGCDGFQTSANPAFVNPAAGTRDFHLTQGSPMVDAGNPGMSTFMVFDPDDDPRTLDGNCDGVTRPDIGADELLRNCAQPTPPTPPLAGPKGNGATPKSKCKKKKRALAAAKKRKCKRKRR
jgi:hypothetical protein